MERRPKSTPRRVCALLVVLGAAVSVAGCGGSASAGPGASFIAQADPLCKRVNTELAANRGGKNTIAEIARRTPPNITIERRGVAELARLAPPAALEQTWLQILEYRRALVKQLVALVAAAKRNDTKKVKLVAEEKVIAHRELIRSATAAGFKDCGQVG